MPRPRGLLAILADGLDEAAGLAEAVAGDTAKPFVQRLRDRAKRARRAREHLGALQDRAAEMGGAAKRARADVTVAVASASAKQKGAPE